MLEHDLVHRVGVIRTLMLPILVDDQHAHIAKTLGRPDAANIELAALQTCIRGMIPDRRHDVLAHRVIGLGLAAVCLGLGGQQGEEGEEQGGQVWARHGLLVGLVDRFALVERAVIYAEREEQLAVFFVFEWPVGCGAEAFEVGGFAVEQAYY